MRQVPKKGDKSWPAYGYNAKALCNQKMEIVRQVGQARERFAAHSETRLKVRGRSKPAGL